MFNPGSVLILAVFCFVSTVANRVVDKSVFNVFKCTLTASRFHGLKPDAADFTEETKATTDDDDDDATKSNQASAKTEKVKEKPPEEKPAQSEDDEDEDEEEEELETCSVEVRGVKEKTSQETVKMYFGNRKRSGGGKVSDIWHNTTNGYYIVTFAERDGERVSLFLQKNENNKLNFLQTPNANNLDTKGIFDNGNF